MTDHCATYAIRGRTGAQPARHLQAVRRCFGADRHRPRRPCRRGRGARRRQRRRQVDPRQGAGRRAPADRRHHDASAAQPVTLAGPERRAGARHRDRVPGSRALREPRRRRQHLPRQGTQAPRARRGVDGDPGLDAAQRAVGPHPERARADRLPVGRPAPDGRDRPLAAARAEAHHAGRADRGARRRPDGRGAEPDRARARPRARRSS